MGSVGRMGTPTPTLGGDIRTQGVEGVEFPAISEVPTDPWRGVVGSRAIGGGNLAGIPRS